MAARIIKKVVKMRFSASYPDGIQVFALTLIQVKQQLAELRRHQPKPTVSSSHLQGAYVAGVWHNSSTLRSSMCLRLISWVFRNEVLQRMMIQRRRSLKKQKAGKTGTQGNKKGEYQTIKNKAIDSLVKEIGLLGGEAGKITLPPVGPQHHRYPSTKQGR
jgi:hypothetical protein